MKIHTSLTYSEMYGLLRDSGAAISFHKLEAVGSRTHDYGYHVTLEGTGGRNNTGMYGAGDYDGATWDEWGAFFGALYFRDSEARCGGTLVNPVYRNFSHYHYLTGDRFQRRSDYGTFVPADTHPRHRWEYKGTWGDHGSAGYECAKCSAKRPPFISGQDWS